MSLKNLTIQCVSTRGAPQVTSNHTIPPTVMIYCYWLIIPVNRGTLLHKLLLQGLDITVLGCNDFYSYRNQIEARGLPLTPEALAALTPFASITFNAEESNGENCKPEVAKTGLGSSAAMTTAVVSALLHYFGVVNLPSSEDQIQENKNSSDLDMVHMIAQSAHCIAQGKVGSGFDVSSAVYGSQRYIRFSPEVISSAQDFRIAERIEKEGKGCLIVVNKWDTIPNKNQQTATYYEQDVREKLDWAPIVYSTAIAGHSVDKIIVAASTVEKERSRRLSTAILNQVVQEALAFKSPPRTRGGKRGRVYYCTQAAIRPPTFVFFVNDAKLFRESYRRYMEKQLRTDAGFAGTPIRLLWQSRRKMEKNEGQYKLLQFNRVLNIIFITVLLAQECICLFEDYSFHMVAQHAYNFIFIY
ncbi:hypothetical protein ACOSQ3_017381 [Xanthoceras sorbifolium]